MYQLQEILNLNIQYKARIQNENKRTEKQNKFGEGPW